MRLKCGVALLVFCVSVCCSFADPYTWTGAAGADWFASGSWDPAGPPQTGDDVLVTAAGGAVLLTNSTPVLTSFVITNNTLTFTNWNAKLFAADVIIGAGGFLTHVPNSATAAVDGVWIPDARVYIECENFTLVEDGEINVEGKGYGSRYGPGAGDAAAWRRGGGYGGQGGVARWYTSALTGQPYGTADDPSGQPGSGGCGSLGGAGGGLVHIKASNTIILHGTISADGLDEGGGAPGLGYGGGSGGGVMLECQTFSGSAGAVISVQGGNGGIGTSSPGGAGGGGRIALHYTDSPGSWPAIGFRAAHGDSSNVGQGDDLLAHRGTLYISDAGALTNSSGLSDFNASNIRVYIEGITEWTTDELTIENRSFYLAESNFTVNVTGSALIGVDGGFGAENIVVGGDLTLTNGGILEIRAAETPGVDPEWWGALLDVGGDLTISDDSIMRLFSDPFTGSAPRITVNKLILAEGGMIDADRKGYTGSQGDGGGSTAFYSRGGGYGGQGGAGWLLESAGGLPYGTPEGPLEPGSGGCYLLRGGSGGGLVHIEADDEIVIHGTISADGGNGISEAGNGGGGSGGGIYLECRTFSGSASGLVSVRGGKGVVSSGPGGGGRIALHYTDPPASWPTIAFRADYGTAGYTTIQGDDRRAEWGTLYLSDAGALTNSSGLSYFNATNIRVYIEGMTEWTVDNITIENRSFYLAESNFTVNVTGSALIGEDGVFGAENIVVGGDLTLTNGGLLELRASPTNGVGDEWWGALLEVGGDMTIAEDSILRLFSDPQTGGAPRIRVGSLTIAVGGMIDADRKGYTAATGPGKGASTNTKRGGGYGGRGGAGLLDDDGGKIYGTNYGPMEAGSGGCYNDGGGSGGGLVHVEASGVIVLDGTISAEGAKGTRGADGNWQGGGGSGGGVMIICRRFSGGENAVISVSGGDAFGTRAGGGGGGRVAVWYGQNVLNSWTLGRIPSTVVTGETHPDFNGTITAGGGTIGAEAGGEGSKLFIPVHSGTILRFF